MADAAPASIVDQVAEDIVLAIRSGEWKPGQRLSIPQLIERTGASSGAVREAIRKLSGSGILDFSVNKGARVRKLTRKAARDLYDLREVLEGLCAARAAARVDVADHRSQLISALAEVERAADVDIGSYIRANRDLHHQIAQMADNHRLVALLDQFTIFTDSVRVEALLDRGHTEQGRYEHRAIGAAILDGDELRAERVMRAHIRHYRQLFLDMLDQREAVAGGERALPPARLPRSPGFSGPLAVPSDTD